MAEPLQPRVLRGLVIGAAASLVLALVGAMGTMAAPLPTRLLYWASVVMPGTVLGLTISWAMRAWGRLADRQWLEMAVVAVLVSIPHTFVVVVASAVMFGLSAITARVVLEFGLVVLLLSAVLTVINYRTGPGGGAAVVPEVPDALPPEVVPDAPAPVATMPPAFAERLPLKLRAGRLRAIAAEDHYLRVHTDLGSDLVLMRMADAAALLAGVAGARVHRSWWVAKDAVTGSRSRNGDVTLELAGGLEVPVSRAAKGVLAAAGWF